MSLRVNLAGQLPCLCFMPQELLDFDSCDLSYSESESD